MSVHNSFFFIFVGFKILPNNSCLPLFLNCIWFFFLSKIKYIFFWSKKEQRIGSLPPYFANLFTIIKEHGVLQINIFNHESNF